jgi:hypothetical protein
VPVGADGAAVGTQLRDVIGSPDHGYEPVDYRESLRELLPGLP